MLDIKIDYTDIKRYARVLAKAENEVRTNQYQFIKKLVEVGKNIMKKNISTKIWGNRSKGQLASSIGTSVKIIGRGVEGRIEVGKNKRVPYQRAEEHGIKKRTVIRGRPVMAFPASSWVGAKMKPNSKGYYVFYSVKRGRYKGKHYVSDTVNQLKNVAKNIINNYVIPGIERIYIRKG